jgi:hypothetical protein
MTKPASIQLDPEDLLAISEWDGEIQCGITASRSRSRYLKSIMRRAGLSGKLALSEDGRSLLVFPPVSEPPQPIDSVVKKEA